MSGCLRQRSARIALVAFCSTAIAYTSNAATISASGPFDFIEGANVNPVGLGTPLNLVISTANTYSFRSGGVFDDFGVNIFGVPLGTTVTPVTAKLYDNNVDAANPNGHQIAVNGSFAPVTVNYLNSAAFPNEYGNTTRSTAIAGGTLTTVPPNTHWVLTATNTGATNSPLTGDLSVSGNNGFLRTPTVGATTLPNLVRDVAIGGGLSPTITWSTPVGVSDTSTIEIQIQDITSPTPGVAGNHQVFVNLNVGLAAGTTSFDLSKMTSGNSPSGSFSFTEGHIYSIGIEVKEGNTLRSDQWTPPIKPSTNSQPVFLPTLGLTNNNSGFTYKFDIGVTPGQPFNIDPLAATGFIYQIGAGDPNFASVMLPNLQGSEPYTVTWDGGLETEQLLGGDLLNFLLTDPSGVSNFTVTEIDPSLGLDPLDSTDFVTTLTFTGTGRFTGTMTPITQEVPEPGTLALLSTGLVGLLALHRRRRAKFTDRSGLHSDPPAYQ